MSYNEPPRLIPQETQALDLQRALHEAELRRNELIESTMQAVWQEAAALPAAQAREAQNVAAALGVPAEQLPFDLTAARRAAQQSMLSSMRLAERFPGLAERFQDVHFVRPLQDDLGRIQTLLEETSSWSRGFRSGQSTYDLGLTLAPQLLRELTPAEKDRVDYLRQFGTDEEAGWVESFGYLAGQMWKPFASSLAASVATGAATSALSGPAAPVTGTAAGAWAGFATYFAQSAASELGHRFDSLYQKLLAEGVPPEEARAIAQVPALVSAGATGALDALSEVAIGLPLGKAIAKTGRALLTRNGARLARPSMARPAGTLAREAGLAWALESGIEGVQELAAGGIENLALTDYPEQQTPFPELLRQAWAETTMAAKGMAFIAPITPLLHFAADMRRVAEVKADAVHLEKLAEAAESMQAAKDAPETLAELITAAHEDTPVQNVYIPAARLEQAIADTGTSNEALQRVLPEVYEQLAKVGGTDEDVVIPIGKYVAHIVRGSDLHIALKPALRLRELGWSEERAEEHLAELQANRAVVAEQVEEAAAANAQWAEEADTAQDRLEGELLAIPRMTPTRAKVYAAGYRAWVETEAVRQGLTPAQIDKQYRLSFQPPQEAAAGAPPQPQQRLQQFAGLTAVTADLPSFKEARRRLAAGEDRDAVWADTGWAVGPDGAWRFEISDKDAKLNDSDGSPLNSIDVRKLRKAQHEKNPRTTLGALLRHDKLFEAYPSLRSQKVELFSDRVGGLYGYVDEAVGVLGVNLNRAHEDIVRTLLHEVQHLIQGIEEFAEGTTPGTLSWDSRQTIAVEDMHSWLDNLRKESPDLMALAQRMAATDTAYLSVLRRAVADEDFAEMLVAQESPALTGAEEALEQLGPADQDRVLSAAQAIQLLALDAQGDEEAVLPIGKQDAYMRFFGEVEARNTTDRMDLTEDERRVTPPWLTQDTSERMVLITLPSERGTVRYGSHRGPKVGEIQGASLRGDVVADTAEWRQWEPAKTKAGKIQGAPEWVKTRADHNRMRAMLRRFVQEGLAGRYWYEESAREVLRIVGGDVKDAATFIQLLAIYSPNADVPSNTVAAIKAFSFWKNGGAEADYQVGMGALDAKAKALLYHNTKWQGRKTNSFYTNLMHELVRAYPQETEELGLKGEDNPATIDLWMYRAFGYLREQGGDDKRTGRYTFTEGEVKRLTAELNEKLLPGEEPWLPHQVQAVIWTALRTRYNLPKVKAKTNKQGLAAGLIKRTPTEDGGFVLEYPTRAAEKTEHLQNWRRNALAVPSAKAKAAADESARSFRHEFERSGQVVTWEAIPSPDIQHPIQQAAPSVRQQFTADAAALLQDEAGNDVLAAMLGVAIAFHEFRQGSFNQTLSPNVLSHLLPAKRTGEPGFRTEEVRLYAKAIQYIFRQKAVPWFRPENKPLNKAESWQQQFYLVNANGRRVPRSGRATQAEAEALAAKRGEGFSVRGGPLARAVALRFDRLLTDDDLDTIVAVLGRYLPGQDLTRTGDNEVTVVNFRDDTTKVPWARTDEDFTTGIKQLLAAETTTLGFTDAVDIWVDGEYGAEHDWQADPQGRGVEDSFRGRPDLHAWVRDRHHAFGELLKAYDRPDTAGGPRLHQLRSDAVAGRRDGGQPAEPARYGTKQAGSTSVVGVHYSKEPRKTLDARKHGTGLRGAEGSRLAGAEPYSPLRSRIYFYVDTGAGVAPEVGLGPVRHTVQLDNLYDLAKDPLGIVQQWRDEFSRDLNVLEEMILKAGFDGYYQQKAQHLPGGGTVGGAVLIGYKHDAVSVDIDWGTVPDWWPRSRVGSRDVQNELRVGSPGTYGRQAMLSAGESRGSYDPESGMAYLTESHNASTALHEMSHHFWRVLLQAARAPNANERTLQDVQTVLDWLGVKDLAAWDAMTLEEQRVSWEKVSYAFETYLFEGKAPTPALASFFRQVAAWVRGVYRHILKIAADFKAAYGEDLPMLTDDVRAVFDRMLASEDAIAAARAEQGFDALFREKPDGMSDAEWADYLRDQNEATNAAVDKLTADSLQAIRWLGASKSTIAKQLQRTTRQIRSRVEDEERLRLEQTPVYRVIRALRRGELVDSEGTVVPWTGPKLGTEATRDLLEETGIDATLQRDFAGLTREDGADPDVVAEMFRFESGADLVAAIANNIPLDEAVRMAADSRMLREYSDLTDPAVVEAKIEEALHGEHRARVVAAEMRALSAAGTPRSALLRAARAVAEERVAVTRCKDLAPHRHAQLAAKARREAERHLRGGQKGRGGVPAAASEKRKELLETVLAQREAKVREVLRKEARWVKKLFGPIEAAAKTREYDYILLAKAVAARFGLGPPSADATAPLAEILKYNPEIIDHVRPMLEQGAKLARANEGKPRKQWLTWRDLTVEEAQDLFGALRALDKLAADEKKVELAGKREDVADVAMTIEAATIDEPPARVIGDKGEPTFWERTVDKARSLAWLLVRPEHWAWRRDGGRGDGVFNRYFWRPIRDAVNRYVVLRRKYTAKVQALVEELAPKLRRGKIEFRSKDGKTLLHTFGRDTGAGHQELVAALLHTGNAGNLRKLLVGRKWGTYDRGTQLLDTSHWDAFVKRMVDAGYITPEVMNFVQAIWDLNDTELKPHAQTAHKAIFGFRFEEVEPVPVRIPGVGTYRGGYMPAKLDRFAKSAARIKQLSDLEQDFRSQFALTGRGFTRNRVEEFAEPLLLDLDMIPQHIDDVLRFSVLQPVIKDVEKLGRNRDIQGVLNRGQPGVWNEMLLPWLQRVASQSASRAGKNPHLDQFWSGVRKSAGITYMMGNLVNVLQQPLSLAAALTRVSPRHLLRGFFRALQPGTYREIAEKSPGFMAERQRGQIYDMVERVRQLATNKSVFGKARAWVSQHAYFLQTAVQNWQDAVVWSGAYEQAMAAMDPSVLPQAAEAQAVAAADGAIRMTQSSYDVSDVAGYEGEVTAFAKVFLQFTGWFNSMANLQADEFRQMMRSTGFAAKGGRLLSLYFLTFAIPMIGGEALAQLLRGRIDDEDDDGSWVDDFATDAILLGQLRSLFAQLPGYGALPATALNFLDDRPWNDRMTIPPAIALIERTMSGGRDITLALTDAEKEITGRNIRDGFTLVGFLLGLPGGTVGKAIGAAYDIDNIDSYDDVRAVLTGALSSQQKEEAAR